MSVVQMSSGPRGEGNMEEDQGEGCIKDNEAPDASRLASESINKSSSFLFDSLYDSSLLAGLSPCQTLNQSDEKESDGQDKWLLPSTQEQQRSELLANEAEKQEAIQWGESSFNLSEWGDSLLVGEHFLEKQSLLRLTERAGTEQEACHHQAQLCNTNHIVHEHRPSNMEPDNNATQTECDKDKDENTQAHTHVKPFTCGQNDTNLSWRQGRKNEENRQQAKKVNILSSDILPEHTLDCSPGLQDIFDRWPSMSDQPWRNTVSHTDTHELTNAANTVDTPDPPQPAVQVGKNKGKLNVRSAAAEKDCHAVQTSKHNTESVTERPGSAGDLIPPTQETPPVTPRVKLTTTCIQSPLTPQPLNQSTPSTLRPRKLAAPESPKSPNSHLPKATLGRHPCGHHSGKVQRNLPEPELKSVLCSTSKTKPLLHTDQNIPPPGGGASPSALWPKEPCETESPVDEGFSLQLSQDASLCPSNSGNFSIIDVAGDRNLFDTFIKEWKTKERYSLALACEKREERPQPDEEIGGKHKRGREKSDINLKFK